MVEGVIARAKLHTLKLVAFAWAILYRPPKTSQYKARSRGMSIWGMKGRFDELILQSRRLCSQTAVAVN